MKSSELLVSDRVTAGLATEMLALFGEDASRQAALRARRSRDCGNVQNFCAWRQAGRLIALLNEQGVVGTVH